MSDAPELGQWWVRRRTGERFEVWDVFPRWVVVYPDRPGNRRPVHVIAHNFLQEFERESLDEG